MTHQEYLQHADECEQLAAVAKLPSNREALLASAAMWRKLAADTRPEGKDGAGANPGTVRPAD
jgi:hypothetical protein